MTTSFRLFEKLLHAETEDAVEAILRISGYLDDESAWQPLGGTENNFGAVGNQQSDPTGALVEKIINSIDGVLMANCYDSGIDPESADAPKTMAEAVELFFGVRGGQLNRLTTREQLTLADNIQLVATGGKQTPNYLIIDRGEGQTPARFPDTFLSLLRTNKMRIPFVQGRFNSGGTGILQFCGDKNYQLIVSRRRNGCPVDPDDDTASLWGFTIVRRLLPAGGRRSSMYVYLAPAGKVPSFGADAIKVLPGNSSKNSPAPAYAVDLPFGTCIKLYNFRWRTKSLITTDGRFELEQYLHAPCLPFRATETRDYRANYYSTTVIGGWNSIIGADAGDENKKLEQGFPAFADLELEGVGYLPYQIAAFTEDVDTRRVPHGVFFLINGQVHGQLPSSFISSRLKLDYLRNGVLVAVDCTSMDERVREDFFMASRDRVRRNEVYEQIERQLTEELKSHPGLQELNQRRRQKRMEEHLSEEAPLGALQALVDSDPSIAALFAAGDRLSSATGPGDPTPFVGRKFPTFFRLMKEPDGGLVKHCPMNRTCKVEFETDAENDYFKRLDSPGAVRFNPPNLVEHSRLWNGKFEARFRVPWDARPRDVTTVIVTVTDVQREARDAPFECTFELVAVPERTDVPPPGPSRPRPPRSPNPESGNRGVALTPPNLMEVRRDEWAKHDPPFTEYESVRLQHSPDGGYDCFINIDNRFLLTELSRAKDADKPQIKYWFKNGLLLAAVGVIRHERRIAELVRSGSIPISPNGFEADASPDEEDLDLISRYCSGLAQVIVPLIRALNRVPVA